MLIIQIALGIVLGFVLLAFLPNLLGLFGSLGRVTYRVSAVALEFLLVTGVVAIFVIVAVEIRPDAPPLILALLALMLMIMVARTISWIRLRRASFSNDISGATQRRADWEE